MAILEILGGKYESVVGKVSSMVQHYPEAKPKVQAKYQSIYAQMALHDGNFEKCLNCIQTLTEFYTKIHYRNPGIFYSTIMATLAMYQILETKAKSCPRNSDINPVSRKVTTDYRRHSRLYIVNDFNQSSSNDIFDTIGPMRQTSFKGHKNAYSINEDWGKEGLLAPSPSKSHEFSSTSAISTNNSRH
jgi:hypothetical protein